MTLNLRTAVATASPTFRSRTEFDGSRLTRAHTWTDDGFVSTVTGARDPLLGWWDAYWTGSLPQVDEARGELRTMELFCGTGGLALGFRQAAAELGYRTTSVVAMDHDPEAVDVYARNHDTHWPIKGSVSQHVDFRLRGRGAAAKLKYPPQAISAPLSSMAGQLDVLLAGPPCQGHSHLNNHTRGSDPRNELYLTVPALAVALDVPIIIIENVPAVVNDSYGVVETTKTLLRDAGYHVHGDVARADRIGWPQRRRRYFLIATKGQPPLPLNEILAGLTQPARPVTDAFASLEDDPESHMFRQPVMTNENVSRVDWLFDRDQYDLDFAERPDCHKDGTTYTSVYGRMRPHVPSPTLTTGFLSMGRGRFVHPTKRRVINPAEAARLQGFPDTYDFHLADGQPPSTLKLTKWIGDAVPMPLGHAAALSALLPRAIAEEL
jgi:DNA (cytosine-5)-methyltransferase 1